MSNQDHQTTKNQHNTVTTHDELDLSQPEAFDHFLESAEDVYVDAARYRNIAQTEGYRSLQFDDVKGEEMFTTLYVILRELQTIVVRERERLQAGEAAVSGKSVVRMQKLYDDMLLLRNVVTSTYQDRVQKNSSLIRDRAVSVEKTLQQSQEEKKPVVQLPTRHESQVVDTCGYGLMRSKTRTAVAEELPSEAMVTITVKPILESWLYTDNERAKTLQLCEAFHRSVAIAEPVSVAGEKYRLLSEHVFQIRTEPEIAELRERIDRIMRRVTAGAPFASEVLNNTRALVQDFRDIDSNPQSSYEQKLSIYNDICTYIFDHEKEWLMVCGMPVPLPGQKGTAMARALRETLLVERDRHGELVRDPKKQLAVDKLIRKLSSIPPGGLSEETDIPEVLGLMRVIDVQGQQGRLVNPAGESIEVECFDLPEEDVIIKGLGSQDPTHKVMDISTEDTETQIAIAVAGKAREQIIQQTPVNKPMPVLPIPEEEQAAKLDSAVIAQVETRDPINRAIPNVSNSRVTPARPVHERRSLTKLYLSHPEYQEFITAHYSSPAAFERLLDTTITQIEAKTVDVFERWLQEEKASPFVYLEKLTVGEVLQLGSDRQARALLHEKNIKYETFLAWFDLIPVMQAVVGADEYLKFGALFARWMIESEMEYVAATTVS
jgi:hypothetical protein